MKETFTIERNGFRITGEIKPARNSYIRTHVTILDDRYGNNSNSAWADACDEVYKIYGASVTEDNTVGQIVQTSGNANQYANTPVRGRSFQMSCNLWGKKVRELHKRITDAIK
jgi:hypothetical protein